MYYFRIFLWVIVNTVLLPYILVFLYPCIMFFLLEQLPAFIHTGQWGENIFIRNKNSGPWTNFPVKE